MSLNGKAIKQRIKSVKNTKKMTKAMEMVSAAKMRKAVRATLNTRMYASMAREIMEVLAQSTEITSFLLEHRPVARMLVVMISSNRGLCGSFNANVFKKAVSIFKDKTSIGRHRLKKGKDILPAGDITIDIIGVGKKSVWFAKKYDYPLVGVFEELKEKSSFEEVLPIANLAMNAFREKRYDKVVVIYTDYKSSLTQEVKIRQLLPISAHDLEKMLADIAVESGPARDVDLDRYMFEPGLQSIIDTVLPRLVESQLFQAVLESAASEHSARMVSMKNASEAAGEMIDGLTLEFNKARQAAITKELAEIAGGVAALE